MKYLDLMLYKRFPSRIVEALCSNGDEASSLNCKAGPEASTGCGSGAAAGDRCVPGAAAGDKCDSGLGAG